MLPGYQILYCHVFFTEYKMSIRGIARTIYKAIIAKLDLFSNFRYEISQKFIQGKLRNSLYIGIEYSITR